MSEMPERVWLYQPETAWESGRFTEVEPDGRDRGRCPVYVPEQRALDAERERETWRQELLRVEQEAHDLSADLKALLPLARLGLLAIDANSYFPVRAIEWGLIDWHRRDTANLTAARAILDREQA